MPFGGKKQSGIGTSQPDIGQIFGFRGVNYNATQVANSEVTLWRSIRRSKARFRLLIIPELINSVG